MDNHTTPMRRCNQCGKELPETTEYFHKGKSNRGGLRPTCKLCRSAEYHADPEPAKLRSRKSYRKDPKHHYEVMRIWKAKHPELESQYHKDWAARNPEKVKAKNQNYYKKYPERFRESARRFYAAHRDVISQRARNNPTLKKSIRDWRDRHPHKLREYKLRRRAREKGFPDEYTSKDWEVALSYFNNCCAVCQRPSGLWHTLAADHWIPLSDPNCPGTIATNIIPLCHGDGGCNNSKHNTDPAVWLERKFSKRKGKQILARIGTYFLWLDTLKADNHET